MIKHANLASFTGILVFAPDNNPIRSFEISSSFICEDRLLIQPTIFTIKSTEDLKYMSRIRLLSGTNTKSVRGYEEKSSQLEPPARFARFKLLIAKISLPSL